MKHNLAALGTGERDYLPGNDEVPPGLKTLHGSPLRIYKNPDVDVQVETFN